MTNPIISPVQEQYEIWPYPQIPLLARLHRDSLWQINFEWMARQLGREPSPQPKIWIAGCGTFQPYAFSRANPQANIVATDISTASLNKAEKRCRVHGVRNVRFQQLDLQDLQAYPEGKFDLIECYGVLMSLSHPEQVLRAFARKLTPNGILRIMVYTHYGRQRIFQIQHLAKLLGLGPTKRKDPDRLKKLISALPEAHPLKATFFDYPDAKNQPGIVDGFLHASDQGFTGQRISELLDEAGFELGFCYHRPWGQPRIMEEKLGISGYGPGFWLHYLDLWQSLKSNFILCVVPRGTATVSSPMKKTQKHPLFDLKSPVGIRHKARLMRQTIFGTQLQTRTHEKNVKLTGREVRGLLKGRSFSDLGREILGGGVVKPESLRKNGKVLPEPGNAWSVTLGRSPNPLYRHLFDAYLLEKQIRQTGQEFLSLEEQMKRWKPHFRPLEDSTTPWGLTPGETYLQNKQAIDLWLKGYQQQQEFPITEVTLKDEATKLEDLKKFLLKTGGFQLPTDRVTQGVLWILLLGYSHLFLEFER